MKKALWMSVLLLVGMKAYADPGTSHIIKAKIIFEGKERVGYFKVWGYLYLTNDSLSYDVPKFTRQAKSWISGDTVTFYSEMFYVKHHDLTALPDDKSIRICKNNIDKIYPLALIEHNPWISSYTRLQSMDKRWVLRPTRKESQMIIERNELCTYAVLYYNEPDGVTLKLVRDLEHTIEKGFTAGEDNSDEIDPLIEQLRERKVLILTHCSPS